MQTFPKKQKTLFQAIRSGDLAAVSKCLKHPDVTVDTTCINHACDAVNPKVLRCLLDNCKKESVDTSWAHTILQMNIDRAGNSVFIEECTEMKKMLVGWEKQSEE